MIFVTVGSMFPFDRLIRQVDAHVGEHPHLEAFAQIGEGSYEPQHMPWARTLTPPEFDARVRAASLIIAHAGMGSIISAMEAGKPIVVLARLAANREATTDHQVHTSHWLQGKPGITVAASAEDLSRAMEKARSASGSADLDRISTRAPESFAARIRQFLVC